MSVLGGRGRVELLQILKGDYQYLVGGGNVFISLGVRIRL